MMRGRLFIAVAALLALVGGGAIWIWRHTHAPAHAGAVHTTYTCPMHPEIVRDHPGECPICGMRLVPRESKPAAPTAARESQGSVGGRRRILYYRHPMNPAIHAERPMKDEMGMDYVPVYESDSDENPIAGRTTITLSPQSRAQLGVATAVVTRASTGGLVRTVGRIAIDEGRLSRVQTKYDGWIERVYVDAPGVFVPRGAPLASLYSPELVAAQKEYLIALHARERLGQSDVPTVAQGAADLLAAARQRLGAWDLDASDIARLERSGEAQRTVTLRSAHAGYVIQKMAVAGTRVTPGDVLYELADLSRVWVLADVYEPDLMMVGPGLRVDVTLPSLPGKAWTGRVDRLEATLDPTTRTVKARVTVENPGGHLRPQMIADALIHTSGGTSLVIPPSAVIDAGDKKIVFVDQGNGRLEPREVTLGAKSESGTVVLAGLKEGERVVVSANFLIDSESSLKAAITGMRGAP